MTQINGKILSKAPCNDDLFEGNAHKRLAEFIADDIKNDKNCTIIGIDGGWGSGKSNLVGLVKKELCIEELEKDYVYHFFTYDAWGHQNDLPRRSILEELTSFLTDEKRSVLNNKDWKDRLENLLAKKKRTSTKVVPKLNFALIAIALLVAATPIINSIIGAITIQWVKILVTIFIYLFTIIFICCRQLQNMREHKQEITVENFFTELFLIYKDQIKEDEKFETISEKEPSTRQFKEWMKDIDIALKENQKHLVIVIDNMDRLPKIKVQELWSAIHSFFSEEKYNSIKVVVPFDRSHIRNAFQAEDIKQDESKVAVYGDDFINKTFYIVYHVAPPILSGWKQYFATQWKIAFGEMVIADNAVMQIYDLMTKEHSPRKIVAFINEFVTIKRIADKLIPDKYIALFIFGRASIVKDPMKEILSPSYLQDTEFIYKEDDDMPKYISSLYYQLPVNEAMDVVYTRQFKQELESNSPNALIEMHEKRIAGFYSILDRAIAEVANVGNAVLALDSILGEDKSIASKNIWNNLYQKEMAQKDMIKEFHPYHKILLCHIENKRPYWKALISGYHNNFSAETNILDYVNGIDQLASVKEIDIYGILSKLNKAITPLQFVSLLENKHDKYTRYGVVCEDNELSDYLSKLDVADWGKLEILPSLSREQYPLNSFVEKIEEKLSGSSLKSDEAEVLFNRLKELKIGLIDFNTYFNASKLDLLYQEASEKFEVECLAMRLSAKNSFSSSYSYLANTLAQTDELKIKAVAKTANRYLNYGELLLALERFNNGLSKGVARELTVNKHGTQKMNILEVAKKFNVIVGNSDISSEELFIRMNDWKDHKEEITLDHISSLPYSFFETAKKYDCELSKYILSLIDQYLKSISQDAWGNKLSTVDSKEMKLLLLHHPEPLPEFYNAFKKNMKEYAQGVSDKTLSPDIVDSIVIVATDMGLKITELFKEIRDCFIASSITLPKLKYFGKWLFKYGNLAQKSGTLEAILPTEMLADNVVISLLTQNKEVVKEMMVKSTDPSEFRNSLESKLNSQFKDDEVYKNFCAYLGIISGIEESLSELENS